MNRQIKFAIIAITIVIPLSSFSVWASDSEFQFVEKNGLTKLQAITSFYPLYEFSQKVGQDKVNVQLLVPEGVEPHDWEPTIQDVQELQKSDLIIINGLGFENWVESLGEMNYRGIVVNTSDGIIKNQNEKMFTFLNKGDPHIWLNPNFAKIQVQAIANAFSKSDPPNQNFYQKNAQEYIIELEKLDFKIRDDLSNCNREFIAFHDAFSYFAYEYDLHQHTILSSNDPHAEPTAKTLENIINIARELKLEIIFTEETTDPRISNVVANEIGGKILVLSPLEISNNENYISRMTENLDNLKEALC
ncbi:MAG: metal ABC transporter substrate-binding protein [Nitrosopumilus sp.]|nr:metal ABC transporter substrate-binding protein [Nitrosopumilus sp.]MDH3385584.1 metal ABC transporter substrate-binding protein [Nitrosopumilus sp.]